MKYCITKLTLTNKTFVDISEDEYVAIKKAKESKPHIILMDIQLPRMNGYEATRLIKSDPDLKDIPIIVITSYALSGDDQKAFDAGANDYLAKPYSPGHLLEKVEALIERRS